MKYQDVIKRFREEFQFRSIRGGYYIEGEGFIPTEIENFITAELDRQKEELIAENARLQDRVATLEREEERIRREFAKSFCWYEDIAIASKRYYKTPSWEQIFAKVGALLSHDITQSQIRNLENDIYLMQQDVDNLIEDDGQGTN